MTVEEMNKLYGRPKTVEVQDSFEARWATQPVEQTKEGVVSRVANKLQNAPGAIGSISKAVVGADKISGGKISSKLEQYGSDVAGQLQKAGERITQGVQQGAEQIQQGNVLGGIKTAGLRTAGTVAGAAFAPITEIPAIKKATESIATSVMDKPEVQSIAEKLSSITQKYPELAQDATDILNLATLGGGKAVEKPAQDIVNSFLKPSNITKASRAVEGSFSANTMQRVARVPKGAQSKFKEISGENVGDYLVNRGIYGNRDEMATKLFDRFQKSKKVADDAFDKLPGQYQDGSIKDALDELVAREQRVSSANVPAPDLRRAVELQNKHDTVGLTMKETNEAKRLFERNVKTGYFKENNADAIARATNIDTALRDWQFKQADMLGLENIQQINKETQAAKTLLDSLEKETTGQIGNNAVSLTDWIVLSGASDPRVAIASYLGKKTLGSEKVRSAVAKAFAPKATKAEIKAPIGETKYPRLPAGTVKNPTVTKPINLGSRSQTAIDEAEQKAIQSKLQNKQSKIQSEKALPKASTTSPIKSSLKGKGAIPENTLISEAKKYKSADFNPSTSYLKRNIEVLNKNGIKVKNPDEVITLYHGTNEAGVKGITESGSLKPSSFLATDPKASKGFVFGKGGKVLKIQVRVKDLGFVQDGGMAGSKGVSVQTIDKLVKGKDGIYRAEISK